MKKFFKFDKGEVSLYKRPSIAFLVFKYTGLVLMLSFTILPLVYLVSTAFKPLNELYVFPPQFFVKEPTLNNFRDLFTSLSSSTVPYTRYLFNSLLITVVIVFCTVFVSTLGAYGMVKHHPPGSKFFFQLVLAALMFSPYVTQIPRYLIVNSLGLVDSYLAIILPSIATAYNFFLIKQFVEQLPNELIEAARIDGAGEFGIYWKIIMPMLAPAWSTLIVFSFIGSWNDYFSPLIYIHDSSMQTLPLALHTISGGAGSIGRAGATTAATLLMTMPTIIVFLFSQNKVMQTMAHSGIKG